MARVELTNKQGVCGLLRSFRAARLGDESVLWVCNHSANVVAWAVRGGRLLRYATAASVPYVECDAVVNGTGGVLRIFGAR